MNRDWGQQKAKLPPWRHEFILPCTPSSGFLLFQNQPIAGVTAVFPIAALFFNQSGFDQIVEGAFDGAAGEAHVGGGVDIAKIAHGITPIL